MTNILQICYDGKDGRSVTSITDVDGDGIATSLYSDGETAQLPLPRGLEGKDGKDLTTQDTGWRDITSLIQNDSSFGVIGTDTKQVGTWYIRRRGDQVYLNVISVITSKASFSISFPYTGFEDFWRDTRNRAGDSHIEASIKNGHF